MAGSTEAVRRQGDGLETAQERLAGENGNYSVNGSKREITVNYEEYVKYPFAGLQWHIQGNAKSRSDPPGVLYREGEKCEKMEGRTDGLSGEFRMKQKKVRLFREKGERKCRQSTEER